MAFLFAPGSGAADADDAAASSKTVQSAMPTVACRMENTSGRLDPPKLTLVCGFLRSGPGHLPDPDSMFTPARPRSVPLAPREAAEGDQADERDDQPDQEAPDEDQDDPDDDDDAAQGYPAVPSLSDCASPPVEVSRACTR
jgi:hypothetical protein